MPEVDRRCQCKTGVECFAVSALGGADQCPHEIDAEDLLCAHCRAVAPGEHGVRPRHCHSCSAVRSPAGTPPAEQSMIERAMDRIDELRQRRFGKTPDRWTPDMVRRILEGNGES